MYQYDDFDRRIIDQRVEQFRGQLARYHAGELSEDEFRPLRLQNGLYIQRFAPMLRIAVPYGTLSSKQLRKLGEIADRYDKGWGHFSTRQNLQLNWPKLDDVPDILAELASVEMHAVQTSGNCIRNVCTDQFAGVAPDELEDPRPWAEIIRQWSTFHPEFAWLPRKFKIAVLAAKHDRAASRTHDIAVHIVENEQGERGFAVYAGGGLGRTPIIGVKIRDFLEPVHLLSYLDAILRVYNRLGRRDNKHRARIKILVRDTGPEEFTRMVEDEWARIRDSELKLAGNEIDRFRTFFPRPDYDAAAASDDSWQQQANADEHFATWLKYNVVQHREAGYRNVYVALKLHGEPPGDCSAAQMQAIADLADEYGKGELRTTHNQNLVLTDIRQGDLHAVWQKLKALKLAAPVIGTIHDMICCPGLDYCSLANAGSISVAEDLHRLFEDLDYAHDLGPLKLKMSGCMNGCGHHSVGEIGILGVDKKGVEFYQITLGGSAEEDISLGDRLGPSLAQKDVAPAIETILKVYLAQREGEEERFLDCYRRVGIKPFQEAVYGPSERAA